MKTGWVRRVLDIEIPLPIYAGREIGLSCAIRATRSFPPSAVVRRITYNTCSTSYTYRAVAGMDQSVRKKKQNITLSLSPEIIHKAKVLAAQRSTSISSLLAEQIESLVRGEQAYQHSKRAAMALLTKGFHLGGLIAATRDDLHER